MDKKAMYKLSYGLFILAAREEEKDNGCILTLRFRRHQNQIN